MDSRGLPKILFKELFTGIEGFLGILYSFAVDSLWSFRDFKRFFMNDLPPSVDLR